MRFASLVAFVALFAAPLSTRAESLDDVAPEERRKLVLQPLAPTQEDEDQARRADEAARRRIERPFSYALDPSLPAPLTFLATTSGTYTSTSGASRPLAATAGRAGFVGGADLEMGIASHFDVFGSVIAAPPADASGQRAFAGKFGFRVLVGDPAPKGLRLVVNAAALRDLSGTFSPYVEPTLTYDAGPARMIAMAHVEHPFANGRDPVDLYAVAGTSFRVIEGLRLGAEYVVQEIEGVWEADEAEGGVRHFVGPTVSYEIAGTLLFTGGPAFGLSSSSPPVVGRAALGFLF